MKKRRPRLCHVLHSLRTGGAEVLACGFGRKHRDDYDISYVCLDDTGDLAETLEREGFSVHVLARKPGVDLSLVSDFSRFLHTQEIDLIHAHQYAPFFYSSLARGFWRTSPPILFTEHGRMYPDFRRLKRCLLNRLILKKFDRVVAVGGNVKDALVSNEWIPASRIQVIYNGVSVEKYNRVLNETERFGIRRKEGVVDSSPVIIQVARLNALKDHRTSVHAMSHIVARIPNAVLWIVGEGEQRKSIEEEVAALGLGGNIRLLGNRYDVAELLFASDAFILTSVSEGIPLTLIEAMLSGVPCVCTDVGGIPEVLENGETGLLAKARDAAGLGNAVVKVISDSLLADRLTRSAYAVASEKFSATKMHDAYSSIYTDMLRRSSASRATRND
jgi:glycosyltransferase involved in cell wall biosynthesis